MGTRLLSLYHPVESMSIDSFELNRLKKDDIMPGIVYNTVSRTGDYLREL